MVLEGCVETKEENFLVKLEVASPTVVLEGQGRAEMLSFADLEGATPMVVLEGQGRAGVFSPTIMLEGPGWG